MTDGLDIADCSAMILGERLNLVAVKLSQDGAY